MRKKIPPCFPEIWNYSGLSLLIILLFSSCSVNYVEKLQSTETYFYRGDFPSAINEARELVKDPEAKDRLLLLMEAGIILHSMGEYKKSNSVFEEADYIAETIKTSISGEAAAFLLNDTKADYAGENFERVLIKFYRTLNYIMLNDLEAAKQYFKKLDFELKEMKYEDDKYKQNSAARYLDAVISESLGNYNDARVQYKNILMIAPENKEALSSLYILAEKEADEEDKLKYGQGKEYLSAFDKNMQPADYNLKMGELVIILEAGKAPIKESRGRLLEDREFAVALRIALEIAIRTEGAALSTTGVMAMMATAENPIPLYKERDKQGSRQTEVLINGISAGKTEIMNDYTETAVRNFNDNYSKMIARNVGSIALKIVIAAVAADKISDKLEKGSNSDSCSARLLRFLIGAGTGKAVASTVEPDLRCWRLLPANFQVKRIFLEPGEYDLSFRFDNYNNLKPGFPAKIIIEQGRPVFVNFRSMSAEK